MFKIFISIYLIIFFTTNIFASSTYSNISLTFKEKEWIKNNPKVSIALSRDFPPFSYKENGKLKGLTIDVINKIGKLTGLTFKTESSTWTTSLNNFKSGRVEIISDISYTKKREAFTLFTKPYYEIPNFIFGLKEDKSYKDKNSLIGKTLAVTRGIFYIDEINKAGINTLEVDSVVDKPKVVIEGKADYFVSAYTKGIKIIKQNSLTNFKVIDEFDRIKKEDLRFGVNPNNPLLYSIIKKALDKISSEELNSIVNKWITISQDSSNYKNINFTEEEKAYLRTKPILKYSEINWKPLSIIENNEMQGILGDFLKIVSIRSGLKFQFVPSKSWKDVLDKFKEGKIDLIPAVTSYKDKNVKGLLSKMYSKFPMVIITGSKYSYVNNLNDLKNKVIAVPKYYTSYNFIKKNYPNIKILETSNIQEALILVEKGKADAFVGHIATSIFYISLLHLNDLKISGSTLFDFEHHYLVQKNNPILLSIINKTIDSITQKEKKEIYSNWIQTTVKEKAIDYKILIIILLITLLIIIGFLYRQYFLKKYNSKLENSYRNIQSIINSTLEAIILTEDRVCIDANDSALKLFNLSKKEIIGLDYLEFVPDEEKQKVKESFLNNTSEPFEVNILTSDKKVIPTLGRGTNLKLDNKIIRISSIIDLSEVKDKEKLLIEQSKMAALGEMIGHIAHQWRQPLSIITTISSSWSIYEQIGKFNKEKVLEDSKQIVLNANYLSQTIDDFRSFIKGGEETKEFNIKELIENLSRLISSSLQSAQVKYLFDNTLDKNVKGNQNEVLQVLINIINNAIDALTENKKDGDRFLFIKVTQDKDTICVSIKDNANGIPENIMNKIYEPYFTTKHESNGTGLGLYMAYSIVKKMGGEISVSNVEYEHESKKYKGANFLVSLKCVG
ncbi:multi-sensor signal transduction histidine kinase [Arcobacter nitrofigilis DSM 7299]|uniref:histidine kinase n=1 Tax=Arcobacter nitrofigilis (strain ATCC 33309 / DSM 7299 / CCUG 15893 / LMG 7604 / NCTC 12251 / CI) TaxID=572480 RepID=D5V3I4_ARCNC|nr:transporter substrate-binding domain-containing protein [Arcobacter nitrofigilis]ADG91695.1 multi-sensor signal transduction histidine kinase [Arcobacter nitrofigilis DSM 7299]